MPEPVDRALPLEDALTQSASVGSDADDTLAGPRHSPPPPAPVFGPPVAPGEVGALGPYRIVRLLGRGGMGAGYAALDTRLQRKLALKVMLPAFTANPVAKERFLREARAAAQVSHDNVVTVYEADERDGVPYIAMQFLEGYPLDVYLKRKGSPSIPQILRIAREAAAGLAAAHHLGLIHRDIKPGNLWLEAPHGRVKVLDFGLARPVDADVELTKSGAVVGTPAYMSAEQARGEKVDRRSDLFSLGAVLYRLCSGRLPFHGPTTMAVLMALGTQEPPPVRDLNPAVPDALAALIHQLLAKDPAGRPQTADEVVKRLRAIARELEAPRTAPAEPGPQPAYVPIQVTAQPEANPFAGLDAESVTEVDRARPAEGRPAEGRPAEGRPAPVRKEPRRTWAPAVAGFAALLAALVVAGVVIVIRNKDGTETRIEAPAGATVTVKGKDGKTLGKFGPEKPLAADPDRRAAEWALSIGGAVSANGEELAIKNAAELPEGRFTLTAVDLHHNPKVTDAGLAHFKDCKALIYLNLDGTPVTDAGLVNFRECKELNEIYLLGTSVTDAGLAHFKVC
jgi:serine/threonine protein kinase